MSRRLESDSSKKTRSSAGLFGRVLVAEDTELTRTLMELTLRNEGYTVTSAANGRIALEHLARDTFDIIFLDIEMPELDGLQTARAIRAMKGPMRDVPIVALTAYEDDGQATRCREAGIDLFLTKPIDRATLLKLARLYLSLGSFDVGKDAPVSTPFDEAIYADIVARYGLKAVATLVALFRKRLDEALSLEEAAPGPEALRAVAHQMVIAGTLGFSQLLRASRMVSAMIREAAPDERMNQCSQEFRAAVLTAKRILDERGM